MMAMAHHISATAEKGSAKHTLFELQVEQHHHDEHYHREIARLSLHQRLNHMALHFSKYAGKVAKAHDDSELPPIFVDTFIIVLSTANILNLDLWESLEPNDVEYTNLAVLGRTLALRLDDAARRDGVLPAMAIASGRIAAACEKIDHLENVSYREEIKAGIARLAAISLALLSAKDIDPASAVRERLAGVKKRSKLHGRM